MNSLARAVNKFKAEIIRIRLSGRLKCDELFYIGRNSQISISSGSIELGKSVEMWRNCLIAASGGNLRIQDNVSFNNNCNIVCKQSILIEHNCIFGPNVCVFDHNHRFGFDGIEDGYSTGSIVIEEGCWIGANVTILKNTHIGKNCVIGAGAIIQGNIPDHSAAKLKVDDF